MDNRLYVGNLSDDVSTEELKRRFSECGEVADIHLAFDRSSGRMRGYAFVTMTTPESARAAIKKLNGAMFDDRPLRVNAAGEESESSQSARSKEKRKDEVKITMQFRERHNMTYELDCAGILVNIGIFHAAQGEEEAWRIEGFEKVAVVPGAVPAAEKPTPLVGEGKTRAAALDELGTKWAAGTFTRIDWQALTEALVKVRAI